jgi:hypothetical protein
MVAMDAANKNAAKLVERLTLRYHRVRQDQITSELIERSSFLTDSVLAPGFSRWHREVRDGIPFSQHGDLPVTSLPSREGRTGKREDRAHHRHASTGV